jgi:hypothetical protein
MRKLAFVLPMLLAGAVAARAAQWHDTYTTALELAQKTGRPLIIVFGRPGENSHKAVERMFGNARVAGLTRYFVCVYLEFTIQNNTYIHPLLSKFKIGGGAHKIPVIIFADATEKQLDKVEGIQPIANLRVTLAKVLKEHGPVPNARDLREALAKTEKADELRKKENLPAAARLYKDVVDLGIKAPIALKAKERLDAIEATLKKDLESARVDIADQAFPEAVRKLKSIAGDFPTLDTGKAARAELAKLAENPKAKTALEGGGTAQPATIAAVPDTSDYVFTEEELDALDEMGTGEAATDDDAGAARKAERLLRMARNWIANKQPTEARKLLSQILRRYPRTVQADTARQLLETLQ